MPRNPRHLKGQLPLLPLGNQEQVVLGQRRREIVQALADLLLEAVGAGMLDNGNKEVNDER
jgi:hypothetical protein